MTIPAIAPPAIPPSFSVSGAGEDEAGAIAELTVDEALAPSDDIVTTLEETLLFTAPNTSGKVMTPTPVLQHARVVPQHHLSPSALLLHGVICVFPLADLVCSQMSRQLPDVKFASVQKFAKKLRDAGQLSRV
ncbi:hypothetical protein HBH98_122090 [Parastagonospora nodorum]|nr:hypothetical protein HBH46_186260 [Parastagonospora nodorum]KAH4345603.1 hypothetical protein HBH98_122090 [Parastagonospora nodorum]KAH4895683.1 hypothetical protein HBI80_216370 [Parastagonospora nodorum]KAH5276293.1 hypothetical protein HBI71_036390 [Parastagonospora nodorum]